MLHAVITTIQKPTNCMVELDKKLRDHDAVLVVAGDTKGPDSYDLPAAVFLDIRDQVKSGFALAEGLPTKHYARKNIGYLYAIRNGASCIYETDDDNKPNEVWAARDEALPSVFQPDADSGWVNVYQYYTDDAIWPRGLPLKEIREKNPVLVEKRDATISPIQQGLVNNSADVDAIWRLIMDKPFFFDKDAKHSILLPPGVWSPFNTQSTWWWPLAYPLLYIPSYCSFRMCDIWKSFIAQRCLWELDLGVVFHSAEVIQERNEHDLHRDFIDEIPGYIDNQRIVDILGALNLLKGEENIVSNLLECYKALVDNKIFPPSELALVEAWCFDITQLRK